MVAAVYGDDRLLALTAATAYLPLAFALQSPAWVFFRRMDYARQRLLQAVVPVVAFAVTVPLPRPAWASGASSSARRRATSAASSPRSRRRPIASALRYDRGVARRYLRFSVPVFVALVAALVVAQGQILAFDVDRGLAWVGLRHARRDALALHRSRATPSSPSTIYPAICAIRGRTRALEELFVRSNRATLLWVAARLRGRRALRRRPHRLRPGRRVAARPRADPGPRDRHRAGAARLQLVLVLPRARAHAPAGGRGRGRGGGLLRAGGSGPRHRRRDGLRRRALRRGRRPARGARATSARCCPPCGRATCSRAPACVPTRRRRRRRCALRAALWGSGRSEAQAVAELALSSAPSSSC